MIEELVGGFLVVVIIMVAIFTVQPHSYDNGAEDIPSVDDGSGSLGGPTVQSKDSSNYQMATGQDDIEPEDVSTTTQEDELENQQS